ncbi:hypothetical protein D3C78_1575550 [compost metagenome]
MRFGVDTGRFTLTLAQRIGQVVAQEASDLVAKSSFGLCKFQIHVFAPLVTGFAWAVLVTLAKRRYRTWLHHTAG